MTLRPGSLAFRVVTFSTIWAIVALAVIATVISALYRQASERGFDSLLSAHLFNLISAVRVSDSGMVMGSPDLGDLRFSIPRSGWYWSVDPVQGVGGELRSPSMTRPIASPPVKEVPFNFDFQRRYVAQGLDGEQVQVFESEFALGTEQVAARFRVMGNRTELLNEIAQFDRRLYLYLLLFGAGMIAINAGAILYGLRPLNRVSNALALIRAGEAQSLEGRFPPEIQPLANETNALIENNRRIVERSRTQVGNLAHSLKTPLAVVANEGHALGGEKGRLIAEQTTLMTRQIDHYLQRARIAAQRESVIFRAPVTPVLERMVRVMAKLNPATTVAFGAVEPDIVFAGEREDLEEIVGNLLENAMKWAKGRVELSVSPAGESGESRFAIAVDDDGPGIPPDQAREALKRGRRLDETKPGTGLGLAIVAELVAEYGGTLTLDRSDLGGLRAVVTLRAAS